MRDNTSKNSGEIQEADARGMGITRRESIRSCHRITDMRFVEVGRDWDRVRENGVGNKDSPLLGHCYPRHLPMSSFLETDIRDVLHLGQLGKPMTHTRKPYVAGDAARSLQVVDGNMTPITRFIEYPSWWLRRVHLKADVIGDFISSIGRVMYTTMKRIR